MSKPKTITIDDTEYIRADSVTREAGNELVIIRSRDSGVTIGELRSREGREVYLINAFRVWSWSGAFTLLQMSYDGVSDPGGCKFSVTVPVIQILDACEIIPCTDRAAAILKGVERCKK